MWHSAPACPCTYESCSCQARCLCLPQRLVTLEICPQGLGTATCSGCSACLLLATQHVLAFCWLSMKRLAVELSLGYSLVWHLPPELVVKLLLFCFQQQQLLYFNRDAPAGLRNPGLCSTCFTCSASLTALPWPS